MKAYSPPRVTTKRGSPWSRLAHRPARDGKAVALGVRADDGILGVIRPEEDAIIDPLRLNELELPPEVRADEREHQPPIGAVVLQHSVRKERPIRSTAADHTVDPGHARDGRVARVGPPDVRAAGCLEACRIVGFIQERVVPSRVGPQGRIVVDRAKRQGRAAAPAAHHLGRQQLLLRGTGRVRLQIPAERRHALVQLAEDDIGAVAAQNLGLRPLDAAHLVAIAQHELACLQGRFLRIGSRECRSLRWPDG